MPGQTRADERARMIEAVIAHLEPDQARWVREEISRIDREFGRSTRVPETREELMAELATRQDVTMDQVLAVGRMPDGKLVWLGQGNQDAGLRHILERHQQHFAAVGISAEELPGFLIQALREGEQVGVQGRDRSVYRVRYRSQDWYVAISVSDNGFILGANPFGRRKLRQLLRRQNAPSSPPSG